MGKRRILRWRGWLARWGGGAGGGGARGEGGPRHRDGLRAVAARAFAQDGPDVTLDAIAKEAGVGIGTLYRHFPTREALVEATYRNELARLGDAAGDLLATTPPDQATRQWKGLFIGYMTAT